MTKEQIENLIGNLKDISQLFSPFELIYDGLETFKFKNGNEPRVIWVRPLAKKSSNKDNGKSELEKLADMIKQKAEKCGAQQENFPFNPHITLARVPWKHKSVKILDNLLKINGTKIGKQIIKEFVLYRIAPDGSYIETKTFKLKK